MQNFLDHDYFFSISAQTPLFNRTGVSVNASASVNFSHAMKIDSVEIKDSSGKGGSQFRGSGRGAGTVHLRLGGGRAVFGISLKARLGRSNV